MRWLWRGRSALCGTFTAQRTSSLPSWSSCRPSSRTRSVKASSCGGSSPLPPTAWSWGWRSLDSCRGLSRCGTTRWLWSRRSRYGQQSQNVRVVFSVAPKLPRERGVSQFYVWKPFDIIHYNHHFKNESSLKWYGHMTKTLKFVM